MRFAYCGYDFFHPCLEQLLEDGHTLVELFTWPTDNEYDFNDNVFRLAGAANVPVSLEPMTNEDLSRLRKKKVELLVSAAYPYKIPSWVGFVTYAINVHPSLLPVGKGPWPLPWLILKGHRESGVTIHEVSQKFDSGDILAQAQFGLSDRETLESLSLRSQLLAKSLIREVISDLPRLWNNKRPQGPGSYWLMPKSADRTISWDMTIDEIDRIVRAFSKFEPFLFLDGVRYFVNKVDVWKDDRGLPPGTLVLKSNREVVYAARDGLVCLSQWREASHEAQG